MYRKIFKRNLDFFAALILFALSLPILLISAVWIRLDSPGSPFFVQERIGYKNRPFKVIKLRTMKLETQDEEGRKLRDRQRVTRSGATLRKLSIDELPQLINILKGDMSFVGPRPLIPRYFPYYTDEELRRHEVLPGITGLAQVNGRSDLQWEERFSYDLTYVDKLSFLLDLKIVIKTLEKIISRENTSTIRPANLVDFDIHRNFEKLR